MITIAGIGQYQGKKTNLHVNFCTTKKHPTWFNLNAKNIHTKKFHSGDKNRIFVVVHNSFHSVDLFCRIFLLSPMYSTPAFSTIFPLRKMNSESECATKKDERKSGRVLVIAFIVCHWCFFIATFAGGSASASVLCVFF